MILVTARYASSRLPGKAMMKIGGKTTIELCLRRAKLSGAQVVLCTTRRKEDDALEVVAERLGIPTYRGSSEDVIKRYWGAARKFGAKTFITYQADNLLYDFGLMKRGLEMLERVPFVEAPQGVVQGAFTMGFTRDALEDAYRNSRGGGRTEMIWPFFTCEKAELPMEPGYYRDVRMTLDYPEDFAFFQEAFRLVTYKTPMLEIIPRVAHLAPMNWFRKGDWQEKQRKVVESYGK